LDESKCWKIVIGLVSGWNFWRLLVTAVVFNLIAFDLINGCLSVLGCRFGIYWVLFWNLLGFVLIVSFLFLIVLDLLNFFLFFTGTCVVVDLVVVKSCSGI